MNPNDPNRHDAAVEKLGRSIISMFDESQRQIEQLSKDATAPESSLPSRPSVPADPLIAEMQRLALTRHALCPEAKLLLEMALDVQSGKPLDLSRLKPSSSEPEI